MNENRTYRRTIFFLKNSSQPRLLLGIEIIFLILLVISSAMIYLLASRDLTTTYLQAHLKIRNVQEILLPTLIVINFGGLVLGAGLTLFYTHRIAGPVYRLCRILREVGAGNLEQSPRFRQGDELRELEAATDEMLFALNKRIAKLQALATQARRFADSAPGDEMIPLKDTALALEEELKAFQLSATAARKQAS